MYKYQHLGFNLCSTTSSQVYGGYDAERYETNQAVDETKGIIMTDNGKPISAFYHHSSGGYTENSENVWTSTIAYLRGVIDPFTSKNDWQVSYSFEDISKQLVRNGYNVGTVQDVYVREYSQFGSVLKLVVE